MLSRCSTVLLGVIAVAACGTITAAQTLTTLPNLGGGISTWVGGMSEDGTVVCGDALLVSGSSRAWRWTASGGIQNLGFLPGATDSYGYGMSGNGLVVVGASGASFDVAHRWTSGTGMQGLGSLAAGQPSFASSATFDGSTIIGYGYFGSGIESAWRWTSAGGMQPFGQLLAGTDQSVGLATNSDGSVTVGYCFHNAPALVYPTACRWNAAGVATSLGVLPGKIQSVPGGVSRNGAVVVGYCSDGQGQALVPFQWTAGGGMVQLTLPAGAVQGVAGTANFDGSLIVGYTLDAVSNVRACVWNAGVPVALDAYLQSRGVSTTGWTLEVAMVAAEGTALAGTGRFNGLARAWHVSFGTGCTGAPTISVDPLTQSVALGASVTLSISATGATGYQWYHDAQLVGGATGPAYTIVSAAPADAGQYWCIASNACGPAQSQPAMLTVTNGCELAITQHPHGAALPAGNAVTLTVAATSGSNLDYQWRRNNIDIPGANDPSYTIELLSSASAGMYMCEVSNGCGEMPSNDAEVSVCYANCDLSNGSPVLTANDFQCFLDKFIAGSGYANCDASTTNPTLTGNDFQCFLNTYVAGCP